MIETHEIINIEGLTCEVNWNEETKPCKVIKFVIDGKECIIPRAELYSLLFLFGDEEQQEQLIPVKSHEVSMMKRWIGVKLKRLLDEEVFCFFFFFWGGTKNSKSS